LKEFTKYIKKLLSKGKRANMVVTCFKLHKATSSGGVVYSQAQFTVDRALTPEEYALISTMTDQVKSFSSRVAFDAESSLDIIVDEEMGEVIEPLGGGANVLSLAKAAGCMYLFIGLESFSEGALSDAGKSINYVEDYKALIGNIHRNGIMVQAGIVFGFDSDTRDVFDKTLTACKELGIDGATVSILTPFPKTPIYTQFKQEGRLLSEDWSLYNSKTAIAFRPMNMTAEELFAGYIRFRRQFFSLGSFVRRMKVSRTNIPANFLMNLGYRLGIRGRYRQ
jgi:hypothetical protein